MFEKLKMETSMRKTALGLTLGLFSMSAWSVCPYNFDVTQDQILKISSVSSNQADIFPVINGQKVSFKLLETSNPSKGKGYLATSKEFANIWIAAMTPSTTASLTNTYSKLLTKNNLKLSVKNNLSSFNNQTTTQSSINIYGDKAIPQTGIIAFEFRFKLINQLNIGQVVTFPVPVSAFGQTQSGETITLGAFYANNNSNSVLSSTVAKNLDIFNLANPIYKEYITQEGYQHIGFYINQNDHQIGLIINGINKGYIAMLPSKLKNIGFFIPFEYGYIDSEFLNKEISAELITDRNKLQFTYPLGTMDICGVGS